MIISRTFGGRGISRTRYPYPSDRSNAEWALLEPLLASAEGRERPAKWQTRHIADAVLYLLRPGCTWRMLPREYPPWQTVYYHLRKLGLDGRMRLTRDGSGSGCATSEGGVWR